MRRGQTEMVGLVFVVVVLVIGIMLYVQFSAPGPDSASATQVAQRTSAFLTALKETSVPGCSATVERVARACLEGRAFCISGKPCDELQTLFDDVTAKTLYVQRISYNLSLEETSVMSGDCQSVTSLNLAASPVTEIVLSGGTDKGRLRLSICR